MWGVMEIWPFLWASFYIHPPTEIGGFCFSALPLMCISQNFKIVVKNLTDEFIKICAILSKQCQARAYIFNPDCWSSHNPGLTSNTFQAEPHQCIQTRDYCHMTQVTATSLSQVQAWLTKEIAGQFFNWTSTFLKCPIKKDHCQFW